MLRGVVFVGVVDVVTTPGGHRSTSEAKEKMAAAQAVAIERAQMRIRQERKYVCQPPCHSRAILYHFCLH